MLPELSINPKLAFSYYPSRDAVDAWAESLLQKSKKLTVTAAYTNDMPIQHRFGNGPNALINRFVRFSVSDGHSFYGYWQPALKKPAPLLINLPGYGGYMSMHPQINDDGYHILHISPLGYVGPDRIRGELFLDDGNWPVLHNTAAGLPGGYEDWLIDCLLAIDWARQQPEVLPDRVSLFGTSQGGGGSLLLASILQDQIRCVCADLPFLTAFPLTGLQGDAYGILRKAYATVSEADFWNRLGYVDTLSHAHRLHIPTMLSSGGMDTVCPPETVAKLFEALRCTKQYTHLEDVVHTHSRQSMYLFRGWLALFG